MYSLWLIQFVIHGERDNGTLKIPLEIIGKCFIVNSCHLSPHCQVKDDQNSFESLLYFNLEHSLGLNNF